MRALSAATVKQGRGRVCVLRGTGAIQPQLGYRGLMLDFKTIEAIATKVARRQISEQDFERAISQSATDSEGKDALRITLVLKQEAVQSLSGDSALDILVELQNELDRQGEERFPIIEYATDQELAAEASDGDAEPEEAAAGEDEG